MIKTHKKKKSVKMHGMNMGTHGGGARKKRKGSGHRGGKGMSGSGKRADQKKTLVIKLYGNKYFGKQGITSRGTKRDTRQRINLQQIEMNLEKYGKQEKDGWEINLPNYKILGEGEVLQGGVPHKGAKTKLIIKAKEASMLAREKVKKGGGEIILPKRKEVTQNLKNSVDKEVDNKK